MILTYSGGLFQVSLLLLMVVTLVPGQILGMSSTPPLVWLLLLLFLIPSVPKKNIHDFASRGKVAGLLRVLCSSFWVLLVIVLLRCLMGCLMFLLVKLLLLGIVLHSKETRLPCIHIIIKGWMECSSLIADEYGSLVLCNVNHVRGGGFLH